MTAENVSTASPRRGPWHYLAMAAALALVALSGGRLITLAGWERTLVFALTISEIFSPDGEGLRQVGTFAVARSGGGSLDTTVAGDPGKW